MTTIMEDAGLKDEYLPVSEAAELLRVDEESVRRWVSEDRLTHRIDDDGQIGVLFQIRRSGPPEGPMFSYRFRLPSAPGFTAELNARERQCELDGLTWSDIDVDAFASLLAARFTAVIPPDTTVNYERGMLYVAGSGVDLARGLSDETRSLEDRLISTAETALDRFAEGIGEAIAEPWPARAGQFGGGFPPVYAEIVDRGLHMHYGTRGQPVLSLDPINLAAVTQTPRPPSLD